MPHSIIVACGAHDDSEQRIGLPSGGAAIERIVGSTGHERQPRPVASEYDCYGLKQSYSGALRARSFKVDATFSVNRLLKQRR